MNDEQTTTVDPYHAIAELYDLEHDSFQEDIELLVSFAEAIEGPILEMGCGTGRVLAPLADAGFTIVGLDSSPVMLARAGARLAAANLADRVTLFDGNMVDPAAAPNGPFGLVIYSLNALMHLADPDLQAQSLRGARQALAAGGQLILDLINPSPEYLVSLASGPAHEGSWQSPDGTTVDKWAVRRLDSIDQLIDTTLWYDRVSPAGVVTRVRTRFDLRYLHYHELKLMLTNAGFDEFQAYGSYELDRLDDGSERILVTAGVLPATADH